MPARCETSRKEYLLQARKDRHTTARSRARRSGAKESLFSSEPVSRFGSRPRGHMSAHPSPEPEPAAESASGWTATEDAEPVARKLCIRKPGPQARTP